MKLHRLRVKDFAGIAEADIAFGPGLNVLFGPNDLGKSTLADAIRLVLLLPHGSTDGEPFVPWSGGGDPVVDLMFATEDQRFWRVRKEFGKGGSSVLEESRNGRDFDEVERARKVDGKLREILRWGIPEPGGGGTAKGLPRSFLATALLSTQASVTAVLGSSLQNDPTGSGKERIAAALQAVAQDPLFIKVLRETQARWDDAFTEKGTKSKAKGSVFKTAADRVNDTRDQKEGLQKQVEESESVEVQLRQLVAQRARLDEEHGQATQQLGEIEALAEQAAAQAAAGDGVRRASEVVARIEKLAQDVDASDRRLIELDENAKKVEGRRDEARAAANAAAERLKTAEAEARSSQANAEMAETLAHQQLELRKATATQGEQGAQQALAAIAAAQQLVDAVAAAEAGVKDSKVQADRARAESADLASGVERARQQLEDLDLLERALGARRAGTDLAARQAEIGKKKALQDQLSVTSSALLAAEARRKQLVVPDKTQLAPMRRLAADRAAASGALEVGLAVTISPLRPPLTVALGRDGVPQTQEVVAQDRDFEANAELNLTISDVASVTVRGGRRDARERVRLLEERWAREIVPHLKAAGIDDLEALEALVGEAGELDTKIADARRGTDGIQAALTSFADLEDRLREAQQLAAETLAALGGKSLDALSPEIEGLGSDAAGTLRRRRQQGSAELERLRSAATQASTKAALADARAGIAASSCTEAVAKRDAALVPFPHGLAVANENAQSALRATRAELQGISADLAQVDHERTARTQRLDDAVRQAREAADKARAESVSVEALHTKALTDLASHKGGLEQLRNQLAAEDLQAAEAACQTAKAALDALPVPARALDAGELDVARARSARANLACEDTEREIQRTQGRLEQVGGAVAREHLQAAVEAFDLAIRSERELEDDYDAWKLLLEQMKEADAAQASNLGQVLAPAIAAQFQALTAQRYQGIQLSAQLATEGVVLGGSVRSHERISVGTREQLSTLYRLCLGEYLQTAIVLDDQLVQSDGTRMDWFRGLLAAKARNFQIIVFTCRIGDYLAASALPNGRDSHTDSDDGFVRAVDLERSVRRR